MVAPFCTKHNEPDLIAAQNDVVIGLIIKSDQVAVAVLCWNVSIRDILSPISLNAELFDIVAFALGDEILHNLLAILEREHLDERGAVDSEVITKLRVGRYIHSTVIDLVVTALKICSDSFELWRELLGVRAPRDVKGDKPKGIISRLDFLNPIGVCKVLQLREELLSEDRLLKESAKDKRQRDQLHVVYRKFKFIRFYFYFDHGMRRY